MLKVKIQGNLVGIEDIKLVFSICHFILWLLYPMLIYPIVFVICFFLVCQINMGDIMAKMWCDLRNDQGQNLRQVGR